MPIEIVGSIDLLPPCDPIPIYPVALCSFGYYIKSASYEHAMYLSCSPTPWIKGVSAEQYEANRLQGVGPTSFMYLGDDNPYAELGYLVPSSMGMEEMREAMTAELKQAETYAVRLTQSGSGGAEAAAALQIRAATQHASIYSVADATSLAITRAKIKLAKWKGSAEPEDFRLRTDFDQTAASEQMITALNNAINSQNAPKSVIFEAYRRAGLSEDDNETMQNEIDTQQSDVLGPVEPAPANGG